jgi:hypothetical protein
MKYLYGSVYPQVLPFPVKNNNVQVSSGENENLF